MTTAEEPRPEQSIPVIGLVGGVASGKSAVAAAFERLGCQVLDGDVIGHQVLHDTDVIQAAQARWGNEVIHAGQLIRGKIAERVFGTGTDAARELAFWESVTHPRIGRQLADQIEALKNKNGTVKGIILDAAVMIKAGWQKECDFIVFVDAPLELRLSRAMQRGWSAEQFHQREAAQTSIEEKRSLADFVIDNSGDLDQTYDQVVKVWHVLSR